MSVQDGRIRSERVVILWNGGQESEHRLATRITPIRVDRQVNRPVVRHELLLCQGSTFFLVDNGDNFLWRAGHLWHLSFDSGVGVSIDLRCGNDTLQLFPQTVL